MAGVRKPYELSRGRPYGSRWTAYCKILRADWFRSGRTCHYCGHGFTAPQLIEVGHLVSPRIRPDLAWDPGVLVPCHGGTYKARNKRCPVPECDLNCNWIAHNSPDSRKDENGFDLPFSPQFLARAQAERALFLRRPGNSGKPRPLIVPFRRVDPGRGPPLVACSKIWRIVRTGLLTWGDT